MWTIKNEHLGITGGTMQWCQVLEKSQWVPHAVVQWRQGRMLCSGCQTMSSVLNAGNHTIDLKSQKQCNGNQMQETMHWVRNAVNNAIGVNAGNIAMVTKRRKARTGYQIREARTKTQSPTSTCSGFGMEFNSVWTPLSSYSRTNQNLHFQQYERVHWNTLFYHSSRHTATQFVFFADHRIPPVPVILQLLCSLVDQEIHSWEKIETLNPPSRHLLAAGKVARSVIKRRGWVLLLFLVLAPRGFYPVTPVFPSSPKFQFDPEFQGH